MWQGLRHDLSKYTPTEFVPGVKYYTESEVLTKAKGKNTDIPRRGCTIKEETGIITNTGWIIIWKQREMNRWKCHIIMWQKCFATD